MQEANSRSSWTSFNHLRLYSYFELAVFLNIGDGELYSLFHTLCSSYSVADVDIGN